MEDFLRRIIFNIYPDFDKLPGQNRVFAAADILGFIYSAPLAILGMVWLIRVSDFQGLLEAWWIYGIMLLLLVILSRLELFSTIELIRGAFMNYTLSLEKVVTWSMALVMGPTALWPEVVFFMGKFVSGWSQQKKVQGRWNLLRNRALELTSICLGNLIALRVYQQTGGVFPIAGLDISGMWPAISATLVRIAFTLISYMPFTVYASWLTLKWVKGTAPSWGVFKFISTTLLIAHLTDPFAILGAGLYALSGLGAYLVFAASMLLISYFANRSSLAWERSQLRSRELEALEKLSLAVIKAPPDGSQLAELLQEHVSNMFPNDQIDIFLFPDQLLVHFPQEEEPMPEDVWQWLLGEKEIKSFFTKESLPWGGQLQDEALLASPILSSEKQEAIGGIIISKHKDQKNLTNLIPAVHSLSAQIASTVQAADSYKQNLSHQRVEKELELAGEIQSTFLPDKVPELPAAFGWQLKASIQSARETSGDFFDLIQLPNNKLAIIIADVADKGMGAALYMALSRTLLRIYAFEYHSNPEFVLRVANNRILNDTSADLFVTVFYGVIDLQTGLLTYCNAGHNPPVLIRADGNQEMELLTKTGIPVGIYKNRIWERKTVQIEPGDALFLYTDGVVDAENGAGEFFDMWRLDEILRQVRGKSALEIRTKVLSEVKAFMGNNSQTDDITLMAVVRVNSDEQHAE